MTHHLPRSIPDILRSKTVEWARLELYPDGECYKVDGTKPARPLAEAQIGGSLVYGETPGRRFFA